MLQYVKVNREKNVNFNQKNVKNNQILQSSELYKIPTKIYGNTFKYLPMKKIINPYNKREYAREIRDDF